MKVLILGINSFTGSHLSDYLIRQGLTVFGTVNQPSPLISQSIFQCDICDLEQVKYIFQQVQPGFVINLAGISFVAHKNTSNFYSINALAIENILKACLNSQKQPEKIILASSSVVYGNQNEKNLSEDLAARPQNHYGLSKLMMECIANWYSDRLNIIIARPFNYIGINQNKNFLIPKIIDHFKRKAPVIELGNLNVYREFNDVEFVCDGYYQLLKSSIKNGIFNICTGKGYNIKDVLTTMMQLTDHEMKITINPELIRKDEIISLVGSKKKLESIMPIKNKEIALLLQNMLSN